MADWGWRDLGGGQQQEFDGQGRGLCCHRGRSGSRGGARSYARNGANLQVAHEKRRLVHSGPAEGSKCVLASARPDKTKLSFYTSPNFPLHEYGGGKKSPCDACFQRDHKGKNSCFYNLFIKWISVVNCLVVVRLFASSVMFSRPTCHECTVPVNTSAEHCLCSSPRALMKTVLLVHWKGTGIVWCVWHCHCLNVFFNCPGCLK